MESDNPHTSCIFKPGPGEFSLNPADDMTTIMDIHPVSRQHCYVRHRMKRRTGRDHGRWESLVMLSPIHHQ